MGFFRKFAGKTPSKSPIVGDISKWVTLRVSRSVIPLSGGTVFVDLSILPDTKAAHGSRRNKHVIFCIDTSSSMSVNNKLEYAKEGAIDVVQNQLRPGDMISIITFSDTATKVVSAEIIDENKKQDIVNRIRGLMWEAATALYSALESAAEMIKNTPEGYTTRILLLSDGQPTIGPSDVLSFRNIAEKIRQSGATVDVAAIGDDADLQILTAIKEAGGGKLWKISDYKNIAITFTRSTMAADATIINKPVLHVKMGANVALDGVIQYSPTYKQYTIMELHNNVVEVLLDALTTQGLGISVKIKAPPMEIETPYRLAKVTLVDGDTDQEIYSGDVIVNYSADMNLTMAEDPNPRINYLQAKTVVDIKHKIVSGRGDVSPDIENLEIIKSEAAERNMIRKAVEAEKISSAIKKGNVDDVISDE